MTQEDIIRMAQACWPSDRRMWSVDADLPRLGRFAALVAAAEREACAKVCDELHPGLATKRAAEIIRARGQA
jgi:hypothetical protein